MPIKGYQNRDTSYLLEAEKGLIKGFKKINIFVGANNSGKSRLLRKIFQANHEELVFFDDVNSELRSIYTSLEPKFKDLFFMSDLKQLFSSCTGDYLSRLHSFISMLESKKMRNEGRGHVWDLDVATTILKEIHRKNIPTTVSGNFNAKVQHVYIPILRGLRSLDPTDIYTKKTINDYDLSSATRDGYQVFSGLTIYIELKKMLLGSKEERRFIRDFERFISESFFAGKEVTLIPDHDTDIIKLNINDGERDREIHNLGDGVQSILIIAFKLFQLQTKDTVLFIEEPEMMMHPAMQRILIETLINKFPKLQVFLTTHSNHFLDLTYDYPGDVAIFSFEQVENEKFRISNVDDNARIIDLLGVRNSSVFLANCVIWTEGVTDRMILRKLLELEKDFKYIEDRHYTFAEYGGSNLENFDFVEKEISDSVNVATISQKNYVVIDNDAETKGKKFERRKNLRKVLGENQIFDSHVEIENLIPYAIWDTAIRKLLNDHPNKGIQLKSIPKNFETKFNSLLATEKIGVLLKKMVEQKAGVNNDYFQCNDVKCLGETKKTIAKYLLNAIDDMSVSANDFPPVTRDLMAALKKFVDIANQRVY